LSPSVHRVPGVIGANAYLVASAAGLALVDAGLPGQGRRIVDFIASLGHAPGALGTIVLTHADPDHAGSAAEVAALTGARVAIHEHDAPVLAGGLTPRRAKGRLTARTLLPRLARLGHEVGMALVLRWPGRRRGWRPLTADVLLRDGDLVGGLRVVHAPGHTAGSIALLAEDGALLTGDAVFGDAHGRAHFPPRALSLDPAQARATARRLVDSGFTTLYPGHGAPVLALRTAAEAGRGVLDGTAPRRQGR
jgi:glyoxylase-like metal-dependent hydrolase (beta-lactamase superfamily II)